MQSQLPPWLKEAVDARLHGISGRALAAEYARMSEAYRKGEASKPGADAQLFWLSYLVGRMPATYAAIEAALGQVPSILIEGCESVLDLGSGPGTGIWAAQQRLPALTQATGIEQSAEAIALAGSLAAAAPFKPDFVRGELPGAIAKAPEADLVILAYAATETGGGLLEAAMAKAKKVLLLVEPGTPAGFKLVLEARAKLPGLVAPCPQAGECPLASSADSKWCHFIQRLERNRMAKLLKGGDLGYEDEKFSYAAFARQKAPLAATRIIGWPKKFEGRVTLELCTKAGVAKTEIGKNQKALLKRAKKAAWGDAWQ